MSVNNSSNTLRNIAEERGSHPHLDESPNPRTAIYSLPLLIYHKLPYATAVTLVPHRITNELSKAQSVQFGAEPCVAPLTCFVGVNQNIAFARILWEALL